MQLTLLCPWGQVGAAGKEPEAWPSWGFGGEVGPVSDFQTRDLRCHGAVLFHPVRPVVFFTWCCDHRVRRAPGRNTPGPRQTWAVCGHWTRRAGVVSWSRQAPHTVSVRSFLTSELFLEKVSVLQHFSSFQKVSSCAQLFNPGDFSGAVFCERVIVLLSPYWWFWKTRVVT